MLAGMDAVLGALEEDRRRNVDGQLGFFDDPELSAEPSELPALDEFPYADLMAMEREVTGLYLSGHPLEPYAAWYDRADSARIDRILTAFEEQTGEYADEDRVTVMGLVSSLRTKQTRRNETMAYASVEDLYGTLSLLIFPKTLARYAELLSSGKPLVLAGRLSGGEDEPPVLLVDTVSEPSAEAPAPPKPAPQATPQTAHSTARVGLYLRVAGEEDPRYAQAKRLLAVFDGTFPVYVRFLDSGRMVRLPQNRWVQPNEVLTNELKAVLGDENVIVIG
jgi:DNA polymerase-3 subunit alpha